MSSKLFIEVREKKGLAYSINAWADSYAETGCFGISGGFDPKKVSEALKEIFKLLRQAKDKGFSPAEIKMAKENSIGSLILSLERAGGWASGIASDELYGLPFETPEETIRRIKKVTNADIKRVARETFKPENFNMVIVGPTDPKEEKKYLDLIKL
jgi:predicted Zn-dependent peptidase